MSFNKYYENVIVESNVTISAINILCHIIDKLILPESNGTSKVSLRLVTTLSMRPPGFVFTQYLFNTYLTKCNIFRFQKTCIFNDKNEHVLFLRGVDYLITRKICKHEVKTISDGMMDHHKRARFIMKHTQVFNNQIIFSVNKKEHMSLLRPNSFLIIFYEKGLKPI